MILTRGTKFRNESGKNKPSNLQPRKKKQMHRQWKKTRKLIWKTKFRQKMQKKQMRSRKRVLKSMKFSKKWKKRCPILCPKIHFQIPFLRLTKPSCNENATAISRAFFSHFFVGLLCEPFFIINAHGGLAFSFS